MTRRATGTSFRVRSPDAHQTGKKDGWRVDDIEGKEHAFFPTREAACDAARNPTWSKHAVAKMKELAKGGAPAPAKKSAPAKKVAAKKAAPAKKAAAKKVSKKEAAASDLL